MGYGVIGNTADSGSAILGSSPGTPALIDQVVERRFGAPPELSVQPRVTQGAFQRVGDAVDVVTLAGRQRAADRFPQASCRAEQPRRLLGLPGEGVIAGEPFQRERDGAGITAVAGELVPLELQPMRSAGVAPLLRDEAQFRQGECGAGLESLRPMPIQHIV
jgi:hypothetical protein